MKKIPVGIQLYSVRDALKEDFCGTLRAVKALGYDYVEFAGYYGGKSGEEIRDILAEIGLKAPTVHQNPELFLTEGESAFDFFLAFGVKKIVIPWYPAARLPGTADWEKTKRDFISLSEAARKKGLALLYHNHDFEFKQVEGRAVYDLLFEELDGYLDPEPDVCWIRYGGADPVEVIKRYRERISVVHLKDYLCTGPQDGPVYGLIGKKEKPDKKKTDGFRLVPLGQGCVDFPAVLSACEEIGAELLIVEQDNFTGISPLDGMAQSRRYLAETFGL